MSVLCLALLCLPSVASSNEFNRIFVHMNILADAGRAVELLGKWTITNLGPFLTTAELEMDFSSPNPLITIFAQSRGDKGIFGLWTRRFRLASKVSKDI